MILQSAPFLIFPDSAIGTEEEERRRKMKAFEFESLLLLFFLEIWQSINLYLPSKLRQKARWQRERRRKEARSCQAATKRDVVMFPIREEML